jgi:hypothetical protein
MSESKIYLVWFGKRPKRFGSLADARRYASLVFCRTGIVVAVTAMGPRP